MPTGDVGREHIDVLIWIHPKDIAMTWILVLLIVAVVAVVVLPGIYLWWPSRNDPTRRVDLGVSLMTGALVAISILLIQILADVRLSRIEQHRQRQSERQSLQLAISAQSDLTSMKLDGDLHDLYLYDKILKNSRFVDVNLRGAVLSNSDLSGAVFRGSCGAGADGADLRGAHLNGIKTPTGRVDLAGACLDDAILSFARLPDAILTDARLDRADLTDARLPYAFLTRAVLFGADLSGARLVGAVLSGAQLDRETKLDGTDLSGAHLDRATLMGVDLRNAILTKKTTLRGAMYDSGTRWPKVHLQEKCPANVSPCRVGA